MGPQRAEAGEGEADLPRAQHEVRAEWPADERYVAARAKLDAGGDLTRDDMYALVDEVRAWQLSVKAEADPEWRLAMATSYAELNLVSSLIHVGWQWVEDPGHEGQDGALRPAAFEPDGDRRWKPVYRVPLAEAWTWEEMTVRLGQRRRELDRIRELEEELAYLHDQTPAQAPQQDSRQTLEEFFSMLTASYPDDGEVIDDLTTDQIVAALRAVRDHS